jgi:non-specific serine/threonine protein kinase/serine/threonine-protein kinase
MNTDRHAYAKELFLKACDLPRDEVSAFLDAVCGGDLDLKREVESLLAYDEDTASGPPGGAGRSRAVGASGGRAGEGLGDSPVVRSRLGSYRIQRKLGEGGMGEVFEAEQEAPVRRRVAVKVLKWGMDSREVLARFESERQALALMNHPNIATILDAGTTASGRPFFAMELVDGVPLTDYCDSERLSLRERLDLFDRVCQGVQHAHQKGVIHRDVKPTNVLVALEDGGPVPKIIDFGVAKATAQRLTERTLYTEQGQWIGTPEYMSPEQAGLSGLDVDTRADVYSLGVILYELLAGALPFDGVELRRAGFDEMRRRIREDDPPRPSTRVSGGGVSDAAARARHTDPPSLVRQLRGELDWIVMKALEKDRARRYGSPAELWEDLARYRHDEPVLAGPPSAAYRTRKFVRRHRLAVVAGSAVVLALAVGFVSASVGLARARQAEQRANEEARAAREVADLLVSVFEALDPSNAMTHTPTVRAVLDRGAEAVQNRLADQPLVQARLMTTLGGAYVSQGDRAEALPLLERALEVLEDRLGPDHPDVAYTLTRLGWLALYSDDWETAGRRFERARGINEAAFGERHPTVAMGLRDLGVLRMMQSDYPRAGKLFDQSLALYEELLGTDHLRVADALVHRGMLRAFMDEPVRARGDLERAVPIIEGHLGPKNAVLAWALGHLGRAHRVEGNLERARELLARALSIEEEERGADSVPAALVRIDLAWVLARQGERERARGMFEAALTTVQNAEGPLHHNVGWVLLVSAGAELKTGETDVVRSRLARALDIFQGVFGEEHPGVVHSLEGLGFLSYRTGDYRDAVRRYERALRIRRKVFGAGHHGHVKPQFNLACLSALQGRETESLAWLRRALDQGLGHRPGDAALLEDDDLARLRDAPEFEAIFEEVQHRAEGLQEDRADG